MRAVLTYHSIDASGSAISVDPGAFRRQVRWLASGAVRVVPLEEILAVPAGEDAVAVTFDDAIESFGTVAAPLLLDAGLPVTVFVVSDRTGRTNHWGHPDDAAVPEFPLLGWDALGKLADRGIALGAHTRTHPDLTRLDAPAVREEMAGSALRIRKETGCTPRTFAYPFGYHDNTTVEVARDLFEAAFTAELRPLGPYTDPWRVPRLDMVYLRHPGLLERWDDPGFHGYLALRRAGRRVGALARGAARR